MNNDYNLFKEKNEIEIIKKYRPLIVNFTNKYYMSFSKDPSIEWEDLYAEINIFALNAIRKIDMNRIDENFQFGSILKNQLRGFVLRAKTKIENKVHCKKQVNVEDDFEFSSNENTESLALVNEVIETYKNFKVTLSANEIKIINELEKGKSLANVAKKMKMKNQSNLTYQKYVLSRKFIEFFNKNGFEMNSI